MQRYLVALAAGFALSLPSIASTGPDIEKVNGAIHLKEGQVGGDLSTVNGSISVDGHARANDVETVNGAIDIGADTETASLDTVNGGIEIGERARVQRSVEAVNGSIALARGAEVLGKVSNVNGRIRLEAAHVGGGLETVSGDIEIGADSKVEGGILVEKNTGWNLMPQKAPRVVIGPHASVQGKLVFKREVELFVSDSASIGEVEGATPVKFSGSSPKG